MTVIYIFILSFMHTVKIDGVYRFIDCYLASPFLPSNKGFIESHWFLARPLTMIYTHFPASFQDQLLDPPLSASVFFSLPHVRTPFFKHHLQVLDYDFAFLDLVDDDGMRRFRRYACHPCTDDFSCTQFYT